MFLDDIFDGKGADDKLNIFNPAELLQNSWSDGSHQQIFAPPNPSAFLPSVELGSGTDRVEANGFLSRIGLPDLGDLPRLPGLPTPGDLPTPPLPRLGELPRLPGLPELPGLPTPGDLPVPPLPRLGELPRLPGLPRPGGSQTPDIAPGSLLDGVIGSLPPVVAELIRTVHEDFHDRGIDRRPNFRPVEPEYGNPGIGPNKPAFGHRHCDNDNGGEDAREPIVPPSSNRPADHRNPIFDPIDVWNPDDSPIFDPVEVFSPIDPCSVDQGEGDVEQGEVGTQGPNYDNVTKQEIKDVMDRYFEDIDGSGANGLEKLFGCDKNGRVDSKEIMDFVMKNMNKLSDREIRVLLSASQKEGEISNAYDDEWGAENSGMSRSDIAVWERQQEKVGIPEDEIVFKPYDSDPSNWMYKRYPMPSLEEQNTGTMI